MLTDIATRTRIREFGNLSIKPYERELMTRGECVCLSRVNS